MAKSLTSEIASIKRRLINKAKVKGVYENFGQAEILKLKEIHNYTSLVYGSKRECKQAQEIDTFEEWAISYNGTQGE